MTAAIIFLALVVGFHACHIHPIHYYKLHRYAGQYLYLKSAELGACCFLTASIILFIGYHYGPTNIPFLEARINIPVEISRHLVEIGISEKQAKTQVTRCFSGAGRRSCRPPARECSKNRKAPLLQGPFPFA